MAGKAQAWRHCHHRSRLGLPCLRVPVYDYWCAVHNARCWRHTMDGNKCPRGWWQHLILGGK